MAQADCRPAVLIVEDEPLIRLNAVDFVEDAGFRVIEASNADEALVQLDQNDDISILFTDVDMPGSMNGFQLAEVVAQNWPPIGIIIVSGYRRATSGDLPDGGVFFPKPYDIDKVTAALKRIVE